MKQTREEQIKKASMIIANGQVSSQHFILGANWADWHPDANIAWEIYNFINDYNCGKFGEIGLQEAIDKNFIEFCAAFYEPNK